MVEQGNKSEEEEEEEEEADDDDDDDDVEEDESASIASRPTLIGQYPTPPPPPPPPTSAAPGAVAEFLIIRRWRHVTVASEVTRNLFFFIFSFLSLLVRCGATRLRYPKRSADPSTKNQSTSMLSFTWHSLRNDDGILFVGGVDYLAPVLHILVNQVVVAAYLRQVE